MVNIDLELPNGFLDEEERDGFLISKKQKEIWAIELDMAKKLIDVCRKYGLKIYTCGGTTLGAVRHNGFIPWDDDMDFMMFREDYEKLETIAKEEFVYPYFYQTEYTDEGTLRGHSQIRRTDTTAIINKEKGKDYRFNQGIFIDIFPIDYVPEDSKAEKKYGEKSLKYYWRSRCIASVTTRCIRLDKTAKGYIRFVINKLFGNILSALKLEQKLYKKYEDLCKSFNSSGNNGKVALLSFDYFYPKERMTTEDFESYNEIDFEMIKMPVAKGYDRELRSWYGDDYMIPRKDNSYHGGVLFDTCKSYLEYIKISN